MNLQPEAKDRLDRYLDQMRAALRGSRRVDAADVEADVVMHIQGELAAETGPVSAQALDSVLGRLGSPLQWVPEEERAAWRRVLTRIQTGPEDWRLAYLCLFLFLGCFLFGPLLPVGLIASFLLARAAVALTKERGEELSAKAWLVYPPLVAVYVPLVLLLLFWPAMVLVGAAVEIDASTGRAQLPLVVLKQVTTLAGVVEGEDLLDSVLNVLRASHLFLGLVGLWWICLGALLRGRGDAVRGLFRPFAEGFGPRGGNLLLGLGVVLLLAGGVCYLFLTFR